MVVPAVRPTKIFCEGGRMNLFAVTLLLIFLFLYFQEAGS